MEGEYEDYLTIPQAAQVLDKSERTIKRYRQKGLLVGTMVSGRILFSPREITEAAELCEDGETYKEVVSKLSAKVSMLELRLKMIERVLGVGAPSVVTEDDVDVPKLRRAFREAPAPTDMKKKEIEGWINDLEKMSTGLLRRVGIRISLNLIDKVIVASKLKEMSSTRLEARLKMLRVRVAANYEQVKRRRGAGALTDSQESSKG